MKHSSLDFMPFKNVRTILVAVLWFEARAKDRCDFEFSPHNLLGVKLQVWYLVFQHLIYRLIYKMWIRIIPIPYNFRED